MGKDILKKVIFEKKSDFDEKSDKIMQTEQFTIMDSQEIYEYESAVVPEGEVAIEYEYIPVNYNQLIEPADIDDQEIILEPVEAVESLETGFTHERISRKRSYKPVDELVRPGKKAKAPDSLLTDKQLISRNKRRARNREAAQRQRDRRLQKSALLEEKIEKLESENKKWEEKYRILEERYQKLEFQLSMERKKSISSAKMTNQSLSDFGNGYQPAKLVQINQRKRKNLKVTLPTAVPSINPAPVHNSDPVPLTLTNSTTESSESFCNLNDFIKVDTPTAKHVEKMALSGQDSFFTLFDL